MDLKKQRGGARGAAVLHVVLIGQANTALFAKKLSVGSAEKTFQLLPASCVDDLCAKNVVYGGGWGEYVKIV